MVGTRHILGLAIDDCGVVATELMHPGGPRRDSRHRRVFLGEGTRGGQRRRNWASGFGNSCASGGSPRNRPWSAWRPSGSWPRRSRPRRRRRKPLAGILGIQAERAFSLNADELVFDYCGRTSTSQKSQVLLLAARRQIVDRIKELAEAAGLQVQSITVSAFACGSTPSENGSACRYGLYTRPTYCEFWGQIDGSPRFIKHIPLEVDGNPSGYADLLTTTIQRQVLLSSQQDQSPPHHVAAYDACGLSADVLKQLNERLGPQITVSDGSVRADDADRPAGSPHDGCRGGGADRRGIGEACGRLPESPHRREEEGRPQARHRLGGRRSPRSA